MATKPTYMRTPSGEVFETEHPEYHKDCENLGKGEKGKQARRDYAISRLREMIKPGQTVYCVIRKVSPSGMSRNISLHIVQGDQMRGIDTLASDALGWPLAQGGGIRVSGCGMDMCFHTVYTLSRILFQDSDNKADQGYSLKHSTL